MTEFQREIISLIKSALNGSSEKLPDDFDWDTALNTGKKHQILPLFYYGAVNSGIELPENIKTLLENAVFKNVFLDNNQQYQLKLIFEAFEKNGIDYMPLKGTILKSVYPKPEMRPMSDVDILIKTGQYEKIKPVMSALGFTEEYESNHELVWKKKDSLIIELHKRIIPSYNKDYYAYFGDGWRLAKSIPTSAFRFEMAPADELIYNFTHMAKHYRDGGIGIRHILDIYICLNSRISFDFVYIEKELKTLMLWEFFENIRQMIDVWFSGADASEKTDFITNYIFNSGSYGTGDAKRLSAAVKSAKATGSAKKARFKKLVNLVFLPYKEMCCKYQMLEKAPVLLPFMWVVRWLTALFCKRDNIKKQSKDYSDTTVEKIDGFSQALNYVGLDFNFKE